MVIKIFANALLILFLTLGQVSFLATWPPPISNINLILSVIIFVAVVISYQQGLWWAFFSGLMLELFSSAPYGTMILAFVLTVVIINLLFTNFFTNRSYYVLAILGYAATICYSAVVLAIRALAIINEQLGVSALANFSLTSFFVWQPLLTVVMVMVIFFAYNRSANQFRYFVFSPDDHYEVSNRH